ncbi:S8/S53 family peptidase [uncultured Salinicola sp.]|uniref:S8 family peptidase n=1 Tax=uncultured Salinicola sp. TaxID=1193542 RepID=UPI00260646EC|nr:S8/S53 family peptidase [uncultured Salinicola sp.]
MIRNILSAAMLTLATLAPVTVSAQEAESAPLQVAVIDSGIVPADHLKDVIGEEFDMASDFVDRGRFSKIRSEHGTYVAGIIAERVTRPIVIHSFRVDIGCRGEMCRIDPEAIGESIELATEMEVDLIQISIEGYLGEDTVEIMRRAADAGIQIVMSAGNDGRTSETAWNATGLGPNVHVVGALDRAGRPASFSSESECEDVVIVMRQGVDVDVLNSRGRNTRVTGTSFAAPIYAAELLEAMPKDTTTSLASRN